MLSSNNEPLPPSLTLFPYTTLFRSRRRGRGGFPSRSAAARPSRPRRRRCRRRRARAAVGRGRRRFGQERGGGRDSRSEEHTSELQSPCNLVFRLLLEKKKLYEKCCS